MFIELVAGFQFLRNSSNAKPLGIFYIFYSNCTKPDSHLANSNLLCKPSFKFAGGRHRIVRDSRSKAANYRHIVFILIGRGRFLVFEHWSDPSQNRFFVPVYGHDMFPFLLRISSCSLRCSSPAKNRLQPVIICFMDIRVGNYANLFHS